MKEFCENPLCQNKAAKEVPVSVRRHGDQRRSLCATCEEAYSWGVQHGEMAGQRARLWLLAVADRGLVAEVQAFAGRPQAEKSLIRYLRRYQGYSGREDIARAWEYIEERDEHLAVELVQRDVDLSGADMQAAFCDPLDRCDFIVLGVNRHDPSPDLPVEAWAYKGPLDLRAAGPITFGLGTDCIDALCALEQHLAKLPGHDPDALNGANSTAHGPG